VGSGTGLIADLIGVAVFAASGASAGVAKRFDIFGVVFVGVVAALGGGITRDLLIGVTPPYAFTHWPYMAVAVAASILLFWLHPQYGRLRRVVLVLDAAGLGLFCATATLTARSAGVPVFGACVIGMITGIGGGLGRDLLTGEIPIVLRREIYAVAALFGTGVVLGLVRLGVDRPFSITITAATVFGIRMIALRRRWSAPMPRDASTARVPGPRRRARRSAGPGGTGDTAGRKPDAATGGAIGADGIPPR
jgi:uncharacterized membrane protein YeiH